MKLIAKDRSWLLLLLCMTMLLQLPALFYGVDVCDTGYYQTFYDNVFTRPGAVGHNFMYYLSGLVGGAVSAATGGSLLALRLAGIAVNLASVACVWSMTRGLPMMRWPLAVAVAAVMISMQTYPQALHNDPLTILLVLVSLMLMQRGVFAAAGCRGVWLLFFSGLVSGANAFTRLPNVLDFFFVVLVPLFAFRCSSGCAQTVGRRRLSPSFMAAWPGGWIAGVGAVLLLALALGHIAPLFDAVSALRSGAYADHLDNTHNLTYLFIVHFDGWVKSLQLAVRIAAYGAVACVLWPRFVPWRVSGCPEVVARGSAAVRWCAWLVRVLPALFLFWRAGCIIYRYDFLMAVQSFSIAGCLVALIGFRRPESSRFRFLAAASILMTLIIPFGSDSGIKNMGAIVFMLSLPVGFCAVLRAMPAGFLRVASGVVVSVIFMVSAVCAFRSGGFCFDDVPLFGKTAEVSSPQLRGLRTTPARAARLDSMLAALAPHVAPGDTLLIVGTAPMLYHLTGAVPAIGCSWPELLAAAEWRSRIDSMRSCPDILMLRFNTLTNTWGRPSDSYPLAADSAQSAYHNRVKSGIVFSYMKANGYRVLTEAPDFILYTARPKTSEQVADSYEVASP